MLNKADLILIRRAMQYIKPYKIKFVLAFLCILSGIAFSLVQPLIWAKVLSNIFNKNINLVYINVCYIAILFILQLIINFIQSFLFGHINNSIIYDIKYDMYNKILNLPIKAFDEMPVGDFISRLQGDSSIIANVITNQLLNTLVDILKVLIIGIVVFSINTVLSVIVIICFPISYFIFLKFGKILKEKNKELLSINDKYVSDLQQSLSGIREIKGQGIKNNKFQSFLILAHQLKTKTINTIVINGLAQNLSQGINIISQIVVMLVGAYFIFVNSLSTELFIAFCSYSNQFSTSLMNITKLNSNIQQMLASLERIFELIDNFTYAKQVFGIKKIDEVEGIIKFEQVCFGYSKNKLILDNISFEIPKNKKIAIIGNSGCGKTTILNLLFRFYEPDSGKITIDGIDIRDFDEISLGKNISIVRQDPYLFNASIRDNLLLVNPTATDNEIVQACKAAYIDEYIMSLKDGYNFILGENGINLSGGQKQRLAIARALLKKSKIIAFDEATSALDNKSQEYINKSINKLSKNHTIIVIAHRLSTIVDAEKIIVMENGKINEINSHNVLLSKNKLYKEMYEKEIYNLS